MKEYNRIDPRIFDKHEEEQKEFRYFLILKKTREFKIIAFPRNKDPSIMKLKYNAPHILELTIHEFFEYSYAFYDGNLQYWNQSASSFEE